MMVFFAIQKFFSFMRSHLLIIDLNAMLLVSCSENPSLWQWVQAYYPLSVLSEWVYQVFRWGLWSIWSWVLCRVINLTRVTSHPVAGFKAHAMRWNLTLAMSQRKSLRLHRSGAPGESYYRAILPNEHRSEMIPKSYCYAHQSVHHWLVVRHASAGDGN